jgi:hypothetical protein
MFCHRNARACSVRQRRDLDRFSSISREKGAAPVRPKVPQEVVCMRRSSAAEARPAVQSDLQPAHRQPPEKNGSSASNNASAQRQDQADQEQAQQQQASVQPSPPPVEPEDAYLTGTTRSLQRRVLGLNVDGHHAQQHPETPAGQHATGSFTDKSSNDK